ncbi:MAG: hypothetical protein ACE5JB_11710 [bacterium]
MQKSNSIIKRIFVFYVKELLPKYTSNGYFLYFNPYDLPHRLDPETWNLWMWQNRIGLVFLGFLLQFFAFDHGNRLLVEES